MPDGRPAAVAVPPTGADPAAADRLDEALSTVQVLGLSREEVESRPGRDDHGSGLLLGGAVLAIAAAFAVVGPQPSPGRLGALLLLMILFGVALRTELVLPGGGAVPTQPVLVGLLLIGPPALAPAAALVGLHVAELEQWRRPGLRPLERLAGFVVRSSAAWSCVAPAAVLWTAGSPAPSFARVPLYLLAFLAQVLVDAAVALARACSLSVPWRKVVPGLAWSCGVDALLAPIGLCIVLAAGGRPAPLIVLAAPSVLFRLLAHDRSQQVRTVVTLGAAYHQVHEQARLDPLTGTLNRRAWEEALAATVPAPERPVGALLADVDRLKLVNDTLGHEAGDQLLRSVAEVLAGVVPEGSVIARLGGDEFGVLVSCRSGEQGRTGDALLRAIRDAMAAHPGVRGQPVSCSLGWAASPPLPAVAEALRQADLLVRQDKLRQGLARDQAARLGGAPG